MDRNKKRGAAFTLIEALVVIFVIGTISSMMIVNWRKNEKQYQLQRAVQEIVQNIRKAQDFALSGKRTFWAHSEEWVVPDYAIYFQTLNPTYFIYVNVIGNDGYQSPEDLIETTTRIETGIEISSFGGDNKLSIIFRVPDGAVRFYPVGSTSRSITVRRIGRTCPSVYCRTITIRETGEISIQ
jgi:type II secretory pathway pseudopilin PulG